MKLIINADDFGSSREVNRAIIRAHQEGILTSCSLMVAGEAFEEAVDLARRNPGMGVGLHLTTVRGKSVLPPDIIPHLVNELGEFSLRPALSGCRYFFSPLARRELRMEIQAQFERFASTRLPFSHIDGHLHHHIHPVIFAETVRQASRFGVKAMRVPLENLRLNLKFDHAHWPGKSMYSLIFGFLGRAMRKRLQIEGMRFADQVYGHFQSGNMNREYFQFLLRHINDEVIEVYFHPAAYEKDQVHDPHQRQQEIELGTLLNPEVRREIHHLGIQLINYWDLQSKQ
jgi:hopanoid biosynthesis associated protein HpnK